MIKPIAAVVAVLLVGCEATVAAPPPAPPPAPAAPPPVVVDGDVPFKGTYAKTFKLSYRDGRRLKPPNTDGESTLRIEPGKVTYDQTYLVHSQTKNVVQTYTFGTKDVEKSGEDAYEIKMAFQAITGDTQNYAPDREDVRLVARRGASGWDVALLTTDTTGIRGGVEFATDPQEPRERGLLAGMVGDLPPPPDVSAPPPDAAQTPTGLFTKVIEPGTGTLRPGPQDTVKVHYTGWTKDGRMFDSSVVRKSPSSFRLDQLIKGWTEGLQLMVVGEKRRLWIPSDLAYGDNPRNGAPAGDLVFDVVLIDVTPAPQRPLVPEDVKAPPASARRTKTGLAYRVLKKGSGQRSPKASDTVVVHYSGWTTDGKMFDSSITRGEPATLKLEHVIKGWTEGVQLMKEGDVVRFWMPGKLAYGDKPRTPGAPAGMLVFDIELIAVK